MPRDASGVYTLPPGSQATPDTTIDSAKHNLLLADIEQALNTGGGSGNVAGPATSVIDHAATYADATGKVIKDAGFAPVQQGTGILQVPGNMVKIGYAPSTSRPRLTIDTTDFGNIAFDTTVAASAVRYDVAQALAITERTQARSNIYAAPFDALMYNGMQINGSMEVTQEFGINVTPIATGNVAKYVLDCVQIFKDGTSTWNAQQVASIFPGYNKELKLTCTTAQASIGGNGVSVECMIEGFRLARAGWGTAAAVPITIGFWCKSTVGGLLPIQLTSGDVSLVAQTGANLTANVAQWVTATLPAQTTGAWNLSGGTNRLRLLIALAGSMNAASAVNNTFEITGVVVLPGIELPNSDRAPLIQRPQDQEYLACLRYYFALVPGTANSPAGTGSMTTATQASYVIPFPVKMHHAPTAGISAPADWGNNPFQSGSTLQPGISNSFFGAGSTALGMSLISASTGATNSGSLSVLWANNINAKVTADARLPNA